MGLKRKSRLMNNTQLCQKLILVVRGRIANALKCQPETLPELPLGRSINLLFLIRGEDVSLGEYIATMVSTYPVVGDLLWTAPSQFAKEPLGQLVQKGQKDCSRSAITKGIRLMRSVLLRKEYDIEREARRHPKEFPVADALLRCRTYCGFEPPGDGVSALVFRLLIELAEHGEAYEEESGGPGRISIRPPVRL